MSSNGSTNSSKIWGLAIVAGVLAFLALKTLAAYAFWPALLLSILIAILVAILLWIGFFRGSDEDELGTGDKMLSASTSASPKENTVSPVGAAAEVTQKSKSSEASETGPTKTRDLPSALMGDAGTAMVSEKKAEQEKATKKPAAKKPAAASSAGKKPAAKKAAAAKTVAEEPGARKAAAKPAKKPAAKATASKPARKPVAKDGKPEMLSKPRKGGADDLKMIKGVGPKMEKMLNAMGVYHFDQIAGWRVKEVKWVDENLEGFKGRVSRDEWVKQAKVLAKGGTTDFAKRVKKGGVY